MMSMEGHKNIIFVLLDIIIIRSEDKLLCFYTCSYQCAALSSCSTKARTSKKL